MEPRTFCRNLCIDRVEPLAGMGAAPKRYVLLHWPRKHWRVPRTQSHLMPDDLGNAILTANAAGIHVALVDGDEIAFSHDGLIRRQVTPHEASDLLSQLADGGSLDGEPDPRIVVVCCTDGKQDPCCARYGFAMWKELRTRADPAQFRILQSTHLGGCRFAASVVVLPQRARYGRLEPTQITDFLTCLRDGVPFLPAYRGNPAHDAPRQVVEHAVLLWAARHGFSGDVVLEDETPNIPEAIVFDCGATIAGHHMRVRAENVVFEVNTRCATLDTYGSPARIRRWVTMSVDASADETSPRLLPDNAE
ncbi:sucrase ferredoxin [Ensifer sp. 4252]|uniref:sucrase ferredoxin n=1 Tax=Ensifer sp. 4252 TaxID=3373915 RepID=UPI003D204666